MSSTLTPYNGLQVLTPNPTGDAGLAINDNFKELSQRIASLSTLVVPATGTAIENGSDLLDAYAQAKSLTPYGNAISATNRVTLLLSPGIYDVGSTPLTLDTAYIDLAGTGANPDDTRITRTITTGAVSTGTVVHTADYVNVSNLKLDLIVTGSPTFTHDNTEPAALFITSALAIVIYDRVTFSATTNYLAMRASINYAGEFRFCNCNSVYGFGGAGTGTATASGKFICCNSGYMSFGGAFTSATGIASGTFIRCNGGLRSFGTTTASGYFIGCTGGTDSFLGTQSGIYAACVSGIKTISSAASIPDSSNFDLGTSTGTKLGTAATQKLGFYGSTPITQPANTTDLRQALINLGLLAAGGATPLSLNGGALTAGNATISGVLNGGAVLNSGYSENNPLIFRFDQNDINHARKRGLGTLSSNVTISDSEWDQLFSVKPSNVQINNKGQNPVVLTIDNLNLSNSANNAFYPYLFWHQNNGNISNIKLEVKNGSGTWETAFDGYTMAGHVLSRYTMSVGICKGVRWTITMANTSVPTYLRSIGVIGRNSGDYVWTVRKDGDSIYGDLNVGTSVSNANLLVNGKIGVGNSASALLDLNSSSASTASLRLRPGTAPTSPNEGDIWYDGTDLKIRIAGTTKTFTLS